MQVGNSIFESLAILFSYPEKSTRTALERVQAQLQQRQDLLLQLAPFADFVRDHALEELEECFNLTFDLNPKNCLEVGWHLYGEDYKRGQFLVRMRSALAEYGIAESLELPDHLHHCLQLLARLDEEESKLFVSTYLGPAICRIAQGLRGTDIYRAPIHVLWQLLSEVAGTPLGQEGSSSREPVFELPVLNGIC